MITQEHRPSRFSEVAGQNLNKRILKSIVRSPKDSPKSIVLQGGYGCGKTTTSRILARALNCENQQSGEPCGKCRNCTTDITNAHYYAEYDSAVIGNVERIRELRDTFYYSVSSGYKVITLDEIHLASKQAQSALLKVIEEAPKGVFFYKSHK